MKEINIYNSDWRWFKIKENNRSTSLQVFGDPKQYLEEVEFKDLERDTEYWIFAPEFQNSEYPDASKLHRILIQLANDIGLKIVCSSELYYAYSEDQDER